MSDTIREVPEIQATVEGPVGKLKKPFYLMTKAERQARIDRMFAGVNEEDLWPTLHCGSR